MSLRIKYDCNLITPAFSTFKTDPSSESRCWLLLDHIKTRITQCLYIQEIKINFIHKLYDLLLYHICDFIVYTNSSKCEVSFSVLLFCLIRIAWTFYICIHFPTMGWPLILWYLVSVIIPMIPNVLKHPYLRCRTTPECGHYFSDLFYSLLL